MRRLPIGYGNCGPMSPVTTPGTWHSLSILRQKWPRSTSSCRGRPVPGAASRPRRNLAKAPVAGWRRHPLVNDCVGAVPRAFLATTPRHLAAASQFNGAVAHSLTPAAVPHLLASGDRGAAVVNISSAMGRVAGRGYLAYGTAKAALG